MNKVLLVAAVAITVILANRASADDSASMSPRARQLQESLRTVSGSTEDRLDRSVKSVSPKMAEMQAAFRTVPASSGTADLAHPVGIVYMGKQTIRTSEVQVAPVK